MPVCMRNTGKIWSQKGVSPLVVAKGLSFLLFTLLFTGCFSSRPMGRFEGFDSLKGSDVRLSEDLVSTVTLAMWEEGAASGVPLRRELRRENRSASLIIWTKMNTDRWLAHLTQDAATSETSVILFRQRNQIHALLFPWYVGYGSWQYPVPLRAGDSPEKIGRFHLIFPFVAYGKGVFHTSGLERLELSASGVPLLYAGGRAEFESGYILKVDELLCMLLYVGKREYFPLDQVHAAKHDIGPGGILASFLHAANGALYNHNLALWGALWSSRTGREQARWHGLLYGGLGWGKTARGKPVFRLFWLPIPLG